MQVESSAAPLLTIDKMAKLQRQKIGSFMGHAFRMTYAALIDKLIQQDKLNCISDCSKRSSKTAF